MSDKKAEPAVYRQLSADMRQGLKDIYKQISTASQSKPLTDTDTDALFHEATAQLAEVLKATESATMSIMEVVERHLDLQAQNAELLSAVREGRASQGQISRLEGNNALLGDDLTGLLTALSFQDITGQRIKRVVSALNKIENTVVELYISSGLIMEGAEKDPNKDTESLQTEARKAVEDFRQHRKKADGLQGPDTNGVSQSAIDDMLSQLGI
ncbi:MAG: chemotaxis protein CheZ [Desulfovibrio sp. MES5]|uniref:protein phosphatase CheZ n=1 Tax=Desulfovibrio sp. MES5 TaxID=1899016 RepID=UPI000B9D1559|nr:protein phosphatase CheZ [Desulfovibrio sp. MES5]OXS28801.1 MAG: chemotaxis protein CheZ [Desulfovibrio sp. MES5]